MSQPKSHLPRTDNPGYGMPTTWCGRTLMEVEILAPFGTTPTCKVCARLSAGKNGPRREDT